MNSGTCVLPIERPSLSGLIHDRLLSEIVGGRYIPGERLFLDRIAKEYGVSRTPIREALLELEGMGFVAVERNSRTAVAHWSARDMLERVEAIGALVAFIVPTTGPFAPPHGPIRGCGDDVPVYLELVSALIEAGMPRIFPHVERALIGPLRIFFQPEILTAHGVDLDAQEAQRSRDLMIAFEALENADADAAASCLSSFTKSLSLALIFPDTVHGYVSRTPSPHPHPHKAPA